MKPALIFSLLLSFSFSAFAVYFDGPPVPTVVLKGVTISEINCSRKSTVVISIESQRENYEIDSDVCKEIGNDHDFISAAKCGQLDADVTVIVTSFYGFFTEKRIVRIGNPHIVQRACL